MLRSNLGCQTCYPSSLTGPAAPSFTDLTATSDFYDTATIQWTVPVIAYTPETYVVYYGTDMSTLDGMSDTVSSGSDFEITDLQFSVLLTDLMVFTPYYYQLIATNTISSTTSPMKSVRTAEKGELNYTLASTSHDISIPLSSGEGVQHRIYREQQQYSGCVMGCANESKWDNPTVHSDCVRVGGWIRNHSDEYHGHRKRGDSR